LPHTFGPPALPQALIVEKFMSMFNKVTKPSGAQHTVTMETGEIARQASGAVLVDMDGTVVLATVVAKPSPSPAGLLPPR
jgi:polyribonucleotide nucleotidyltransferase